MDLIIRNARLSDRPASEPPVDIGIENGRIAAIGPNLAAEGPFYDAGGQPVFGSPTGDVRSITPLDRDAMRPLAP